MIRSTATFFIGKFHRGRNLEIGSLDLFASIFLQHMLVPQQTGNRHFTNYPTIESLVRRALDGSGSEFLQTWTASYYMTGIAGSSHVHTSFLLRGGILRLSKKLVIAFKCELSILRIVKIPRELRYSTDAFRDFETIQISA